MNSGAMYMSSFVSEGTAEDVTVMFGFVPAHVILVTGEGATNSDVYEWYNPDYFPQVTNSSGANDVLITTGSTGVRTRGTSGISAHEGGTAITSSNDENFRVWETGVAPSPTAVPVSKAGITIAAAIQGNTAICLVKAWRGDR